LNTQRLVYLIKKHQQGTCSDTEKAELYQLMQNPGIENDMLQLWEQLYEEKSLDIAEEDRKRLYERILSQPQVRGAIKPFSQKIIWSGLRKVAAIAAVFVILLTAYFVLFQQQSEHTDTLINTSRLQAEVMPGSNKARIVFEDGTYQELGEDVKSNVEKSKLFTIGTQDEGISYHETTDVGRGTPQIHTLITPIGGEYAIRLADGTKVWLNADSKLKYPVSFHGAGVREVELEGEAYFDVAKSEVNHKRVPFVVKSKGQVLEVLGTEFNINTFRNKVTTTLIEGSIKLSFDGKSADRSYILKPKDQSVYDDSNQKISVAKIDPYYVTAWKSGDFAFDNAPLKDVMEDIARWYDVSIEYKSEVSDIRFSGKVSRFENIETLLHTIEWTGSVKLKLNGRRIIVMK